MKSIKPLNILIIISILILFSVFLLVKNPSKAQNQATEASGVLICSELKATDFSGEKFKSAEGKPLYAKLIQGVDGWVFHPQDFKSFTLSQEALLYLDRFNSHLLSQGTRLVILKIPQRGQLYDHYVSDVYNDIGFSVEQVDQAYIDMVTQLQDVGIITPNLLIDFKEHIADLIFFKSDAHWTDKAQQLASQNIFESLKGVQEYRSLKKKEFDLLYAEPRDFAGQYATWIEENCGHSVPVYPAIKARAEQIEPNSQQNTLFSNEPTETILVGTSQSLPNSRLWNFSAHLEKTLSVPVSNESIGGSEGLALLDFFINSESWQNDHSKIIIWEHDDIPSFSINHLRQIIAASQTTCTPKSNLITSFFTNTEENLEALDLSVKFGDYIKIQTDTNTNEILQIQIIYSDSFKENLSLGHRKIESHGQYYLELLDNHDSIKSINFNSMSTTLANNITWQICSPINKLTVRNSSKLTHLQYQGNLP